MFLTTSSRCDGKGDRKGAGRPYLVQGNGSALASLGRAEYISTNPAAAAATRGERGRFRAPDRFQLMIFDAVSSSCSTHACSFRPNRRNSLANAVIVVADHGVCGCGRDHAVAP